MHTAEILCLGNELLIGRTINTNANYLSMKLTQLGLKVTRVTTIRDDMDVAINTVREILSRSPSIICISGGLGPTHDDIQLEMIAKALGREIGLNQKAYQMIEKKYEVMNTSRTKMAMLPKGGTPLKNSQGSAPGVFILEENTLLFSLPGVPREMKAIFEEEIIELIKEHLEISSKLLEFNIDIRGARESDIIEITETIRNNYPQVNFKSHPAKDDTGYFLSLSTYMLGNKENIVKSALEDWLLTIEDQFEVERMTEIDNYFREI